MEHRRLAFMTSPGEPLLLARDAVAIVDRYAAFLRWSALPSEQVVADPLVAVPLPMANRQAGPRGFALSTNPEVFWHPLMWLPPRLALRYRLVDATGEDVETATEWAVRVAIESTMSGLFDPESGTWLDVLSLYGLDIADEATKARVSAWLTGSADPVLDGIDLSELTELPADPHWALTATAELLPTMTPASWALLADDLARRVGEVAVPGADISDALPRVKSLTALAQGLIAAVPAAPGLPLPAETWQRIASELEVFAGTPESLIEGPLDELSESLYRIRDDYWPFVEAIEAEAEATAALTR